MEHLSDRDKWEMAVDAVSAEFAQLIATEKLHIGKLADAAYCCKNDLHSIAAAVNAAVVCAACGGECCRTGKYHFTMVDLLVYLVRGKELFTPLFEQSGCPYLGPEGCFMEPGFRPFNCVTFNCELVEDLLAADEKEQLDRLERELRQTYAGFEKHFGRRLMAGLLMSSESTQSETVTRQTSS